MASEPSPAASGVAASAGNAERSAPADAAAISASSAAAAAAGTWFMLDPQGQPQGPYTAPTVTGWLASKAVSLDTLIWAEGRGEWEPVSRIPELQAQLTQAEAALAAAQASTPAAAAAPVSVPAAAGTATLAAGPTAGGSRAQENGHATTSAAAEPPEADGQLAEFQAELAAFDPEAAAAIDPVAAAAPAEPAPGTPPEDEREFEDDDGTAYVWDAALRKFVEKGAAAPSYDMEQMTFEAEEEKIPAMPPPEALEEKAEELVELHSQPGASTSAPAEPQQGAGTGAKAGAKQKAEENAEELAEQRSQPGASTSAPAEQQQGAAGAKAGAKRKAGKDQTAADVVAKHAERAAKAKEQGKQWFDLQQNTSVYVTGLPTDVTEPEFAEVFAKCGIIKEDEDRQPRVKIYRDKGSGFAKGDGLVTYLKEPSVDLAVKILDGSFFRAGEAAPLTVQRAKFEMHGEFQAKKRGNARKRKKTAQIVEDKALGWGGFDDKIKDTEVTVILSHMFSPDELAAEPHLGKELEADITSECARLGPLVKVKVYPHHPDGVASVKFKAPDAAAKCIGLMSGRFFGGRQVEANLWDGIAKYGGKPKETPEEQAARLEAFTAGLQQDEEDAE